MGFIQRSRSFNQSVKIDILRGLLELCDLELSERSKGGIYIGTAASTKVLAVVLLETWISYP